MTRFQQVKREKKRQALRAGKGTEIRTRATRTTPCPKELADLIRRVNLLPQDSVNLGGPQAISYLSEYVLNLSPELQTLIGPLSSSSDLAAGRINYSALANYNALVGARLLLEALARKNDEVRVGIASSARTTMLKRWSVGVDVLRTIWSNLAPQLSTQHVFVSLMLDRHGKIEIAPSDAIKPLGGIDVLRIRRCPVCKPPVPVKVAKPKALSAYLDAIDDWKAKLLSGWRQESHTIFWAGRIDQPACSPKCVSALRSRRWRDKSLEYKVNRYHADEERAKRGLTPARKHKSHGTAKMKG